MSFFCKECGKEFETERRMHSHLKAHGLRMASYYQKHFPRYDMYDGEMIKFKDKRHYFDSDFNSRVNQRKWLEQQPLETSRSYLKNIIAKRKEKKDLIFSPCQVELRTLMTPSIITYEKYFDDYYDMCSSIGLKNKFKKVEKIIEGSVKNERDDLKVYIDTREQMPLKFNIESEAKALKYGDYALSDKSLTCNCYIERKSLADFISTISVLNHERFCNEIKRAEEDNANLVVVVEEGLNKALAFKHLPHISKKIKATPEYIFHKVRQIIQEYNSVQFLFVNGRKESVRVIEKIFFSGCVYKDVDLQLAYDKKIL